MLQGKVLSNPDLIQVVHITPWAVARAPAHYFEGRGASVTTDPLFELFLRDHNPYEHLDKEFYCSLYQTDGGMDNDIKSQFAIVRTLTPSLLHVVLRYLSTKKGFVLLDIPQGGERISIIVGYADGNVYYIERTSTSGGHAINLRARRSTHKDQWGNDKPLVMVF